MASPPNRSSRAGGSLLALAILGGVVIGAILGQPSIGFLAGLGVGAAALTLLWLMDRKA